MKYIPVVIYTRLIDDNYKQVCKGKIKVYDIIPPLYGSTLYRCRSSLLHYWYTQYMLASYTKRQNSIAYGSYSCIAYITIQFLSVSTAVVIQNYIMLTFYYIDYQFQNSISCNIESTNFKTRIGLQAPPEASTGMPPIYTPPKLCLCVRLVFLCRCCSAGL